MSEPRRLIEDGDAFEASLLRAARAFTPPETGRAKTLAALGLAAGAAVSVVLVRVVNRQSFHWGMEIHWPWLALGILAGAVVLLCALGAAAAGRAAVAREAVDAVKDDA